MELFKDLQYYDEEQSAEGLLNLYERLLKNYLSIIIALKSYKIPYA